MTPTDTQPIRAMTAADIPNVVLLDALAGDARWTEGQWTAELAKPTAQCRVATSATNGTPGIVGFAVGWVIRPELQIASITVHPAFRRRGLGRQLLNALLQEATRQGCHQSTLEVRAGNAPAQGLYRAAGFVPTGVRRDLYTQPKDDAILMEKTW